jgi:hypothetical protein
MLSSWPADVAAITLTGGRGPTPTIAHAGASPSELYDANTKGQPAYNNTLETRSTIETEYAALGT